MTVTAAPVPMPGKGEVLVEVALSAVNAMDVEIREGGWARQVRRFRRAGPVVTGFEFSGVARSDGARIRAGERVIGYSPVLSGPRCHGRFVALAETALGVIPDSIDDRAAAALVVPGLTAIEILERIAPVGVGQTVLVIGAAGGVGVQAVQLAAARGARVTAVAAGENAQWLMEEGANAVRATGREPALRAGDQFDLVIDTPAALSFRAVRPFLAPRGCYVSSDPLADLSGFALAALSKKRAGFLAMLSTGPSHIARLMALAERGDLRPAIDSIHPLIEANAAFDRFATRGKRGRVLLRIGSADH